MMASRLFYLFVIALLAATPALAADKEDAGAAPVRAIEKDDVPEEPVDDNRMQMPDVPKQNPDAKPVHDHTHTHKKPDATADKKPADAKAHEDYGPVTLGAILEPEGKVEKGKEAPFFLTLLNKDHAPLKADDLVERHTRKLHLLIADESLNDYVHLHPENTGNRWRFSFTPKTAHNYKIWADVQVKGEAPQMMAVLLKGTEPCSHGCVDKRPDATAEFSGNKAELSFAEGLFAGAAAEGKVTIVSRDGKPFDKLEPVMGAYAHIVAFSADLRNLAHVHPTGAVPEKETDRGAAPLSFMLHPKRPGVLKLFVQIKVDGKDVFLPFSVDVKAPEAPAAATPPAK